MIEILLFIGGLFLLQYLWAFLFGSKEEAVEEFIVQGICPRCEGKKVETVYRTEIQNRRVSCDGGHCSNGRNAYDPDYPCSTCSGWGYVWRDVEVQVPVGEQRCSHCLGSGKYDGPLLSEGRMRFRRVRSRIRHFALSIVLLAVCAILASLAIGALQTVFGYGPETAATAEPTLLEELLKAAFMIVLFLLCLLGIYCFARRAWRSLRIALKGEPPAAKDPPPQIPAA